jgi:hypothetical protein
MIGMFVGTTFGAPFKAFLAIAFAKNSREEHLQGGSREH